MQDDKSYVDGYPYTDLQRQTLMRHSYRRNAELSDSDRRAIADAAAKRRRRGRAED